MCEKVSLRHFLIGVHSSDEGGAEMGGRCRCGGRPGHSESLVTARSSEGDREPVRRQTVSPRAQTRGDRHAVAAVML